MAYATAKDYLDARNNKLGIKTSVTNPNAYIKTIITEDNLPASILTPSTYSIAPLERSQTSTKVTSNGSSGSIGSRGGSDSSAITAKNIMKDMGGGSSGGSSGGSASYDPTKYMIDLSNILSAYEQAAESNKNIAKQQYDSARNDLRTSLERYQQQHAADVANQQRSYLSNQAMLEAAIAQADRQNRISAAARGLGGSGLQQLAQLQNLLNQGQNISDLATENQQAVDKLRTALANKEEDYDTAIANALATYNNTLSSIDSTLATNKAQAEQNARADAIAKAFSAEQNALNRQFQAQQNALSRSQNSTDLANALSQAIENQKESYTDIVSKVNNSNKAKDLTDPYTGNKFKDLGLKNKDDIQSYLYTAARSNARSILEQANVGTDSNTSNSFLNSLLDIYQNR